MSKLTRLADSSPSMGNFSAAGLGLKPGAVYESFGFKTVVFGCRKHKEKLVKSYPIPPLLLCIFKSEACIARPTVPVRVTISPTVLVFHLLSISHNSKTTPRHFPLIVFRECTTSNPGNLVYLATVTFRFSALTKNTVGNVLYLRCLVAKRRFNKVVGQKR